ncbi:hypothetical protein L486_02938 [Kwoniella mangroviensis CBS 10435]|uniref:Uncharacterized protein n=1 Tax=Kwoniella mangroviensis CBS 10435 TaxID=1331196 RepID=A0A1B9IXL4_9TREE|nr:hypothetical protein L486_02938 [Kwoniella mangroviensis CBS 10435]
MRSVSERLSGLTASFRSLKSLIPSRILRRSKRDRRPSRQDWEHSISPPTPQYSTYDFDASEVSSRSLRSSWRGNDLASESVDSRRSAILPLQEWYRVQSTLNYQLRHQLSATVLFEQVEQVESQLSNATSFKRLAKTALEESSSRTEGYSERDVLLSRVVYAEAELKEYEARESYNSAQTDWAMSILREERLNNDYRDLAQGSKPRRRDDDDDWASRDPDHYSYLKSLDDIARHLGLENRPAERSYNIDRPLTTPPIGSSHFNLKPVEPCSTASSTSTLSRENPAADEYRDGRSSIASEIAKGNFTIPNWAIDASKFRALTHPSQDTKKLFNGKPLRLDYPSDCDKSSSSPPTSNDSNQQLSFPLSLSLHATGPPHTDQLLLTAGPSNDGEDDGHIDYFPQRSTPYSSSSRPWTSEGFLYKPLSRFDPQKGHKQGAEIHTAETASQEDDLSSIFHWFDDRGHRSTETRMKSSLTSGLKSFANFVSSRATQLERFAESRLDDMLSH